VVLFPTNPVAYIAATPACADQLGIGALLAWCWHTRLHEAVWFRRWHSLALCLLVLVPALVRWPDHPAIRVLSPFVQALAFAALVHRAALGFDGALGRILTWAPLLWIGKISYGLYLVHNFAHWWGPRVLRQLTQYRMAYLPSETAHVCYLVALSFIGATLSWYLLEAPLNRLKNRFSY
jgi:peptidoglycan/LPS O-acetylase OafA/YrhL